MTKALKTEAISVRIPEHLKKDLEAIAASESRSLANLTTLILQRFVDDHREKAKGRAK